MKRVKTGINIPMLARVVGLLVVIEAIFMLVPLATAFYYHESDSTAFAIGAIFTAVAGLLMV